MAGTTMILNRDSTKKQAMSMERYNVLSYILFHGISNLFQSQYPVQFAETFSIHYMERGEGISYKFFYCTVEYVPKGGGE